MNHKATVKHEKFYPGLNLLPSGEFQSRSFRLFKKKNPENPGLSADNRVNIRYTSDV